MTTGMTYKPTPKRLCEDFIDQAVKVWNWIRISELWRSNISEESITDFSLLELQVKHPYEIKTQKITKRREARIGTDWEWWLTSGGSWLGLRVQAKKISPASLSYQNIDKKTKHGRQIELLIKHSKSQLPMIPIYVFYNYWDIDQFDPTWLCGTYSKLPEMLGCGVSHAISVKSILDQGSNKLKDIANMMYPWSCLVCCQGFSEENGKLPFRAFDFLFGAFKKHFRETDLRWHAKEELITEAPPSYVYKILEGVELSEEDWHQIKVDRITLIIEKSKENPLSTHSFREDK